jgi:hypothetical protein
MIRDIGSLFNWQSFVFARGQLAFGKLKVQLAGQLPGTTTLRSCFFQYDVSNIKTRTYLLIADY